MEQPTKAQIKEFWERYGFEWRKSIQLRTELTSKGIAPILSQEGWYFGDEFFKNDFMLPPIDLNNLFKYAVPKLKAPDYLKFRIRKEGYMCEVRCFGVQENAYYYEDPALALFWAIWGVKTANES